MGVNAYSEVARLALAAGELLAYLVGEIMSSAAGEGSFPDGLFLEFDRHVDGLVKDNASSKRWVSLIRIS